MDDVITHMTSEYDSVSIVYLDGMWYCGLVADGDRYVGEGRSIIEAVRDAKAAEAIAMR